MDDLTGEQYEQVLHYMQSVGEEDFSAAVAALQQHDFNIAIAINRRFQAHPPHSPSEAARRHAGDEEIVRRYIDFSNRRRQEWSVVAVLLDIVKYLLGGILRLLLGLLPISIATRYFGSPFEKTYFARIRQHYAHRPLNYYLPKTKNLSSKSVLLLISPRAEHPDVTALLNNAPLRRKIDQNFFLTCYVAESAQLSKVPGSKEAPQLIALRWNIFQELVQVGREKNLKGFSDQLGRWAHEGRNLFKRDCNVLIKFRNYIARANGIHYEEEEEEEVSLAQRQSERHEIHQQNQAYLQMEEATRRSKQEEAERRRKEEQEERAREELVEQRRIRKMSIPDEPTSGSIIRLSFRCPDGSTLIRNFHSDQKVELLFHWVELNEGIEFQDEKRQFQIMYSYPPQPLSSQKDRLLRDVFESDQEKVLIREI